MKKIKKIIAILLSVLMVLSLAACGNNTESDDNGVSKNQNQEKKSHKIAVALSSVGSPEMLQKEYLENYVGAAFNTEFMFSEAMSDTENIITFLENAYASGCEAVMVFPTDGQEQVIAKANELGMYIVTNSSTMPGEDISSLPYYMGNVSSGVEIIAADYGEIVRKMMSDEEEHNVIIVSGGAGMGSRQHYECTVAILENLQEIYGLKYGQPIEEIASSTKQLEVDTGSDMKIMIYPGFAGSDTYVPGMSTILQTGDYDTVLCCYQIYSQFSVAIDEVEREYGQNIRVASVASVDDSCKTAFSTKDVFGNPSIDAVLVKPICALTAEMFVVLYNALEGNADQIRETKGAGSVYTMPFWYAYGAEEFEELSGLDNSEESYAFKVEDLEKLLVSNDSSVDFQTIYDAFLSCTAQSLIEK